MTGPPQAVAGVRMAGHPDLLYVEADGIQLQTGDRVSIHTPTEDVPGYAVIEPEQLEVGQAVAVAGSLDRREGKLVATLTEEPSAPSARHIGAAVDGPARSAKEASIHELYRVYASPTPRLGSRIDARAGAGVVVTLDRERDVIVVELDTGGTVEIDGNL